ncbi:MAG: hypothetical protein ACF8NJ_09365, partial [Phycisphaerales bacterium JB038]
RRSSDLEADSLSRLPGEVVFPLLHGPWGEGGPLQELLEADGRPFVGCGSRAAADAIDKLITKNIARSIHLPVLKDWVVAAGDALPTLPYPVIVKPIDDGSSVDLYRCESDADVDAARAEAHQRHERLMIEPFVAGRELTVGILAGEALPVLEIKPAEGLYTYDAKYERDDTVYDTSPLLALDLANHLREMSARLFAEMRCLHLARVDWLLDPARGPYLLEINTMPGFTSHSLVPMAAQKSGLDMLVLCERLVRLAVADHPTRRRGLDAGEMRLA